MRVSVNGEMKEVPDGLTVTGLLQHLGVKPELIAIERNLDILPRSAWANTTIQANDSFEIIHFVGGG